MEVGKKIAAWIKQVAELRDELLAQVDGEILVAHLDPGEAGYASTNQLRQSQGKWCIHRNEALRYYPLKGDAKITRCYGVSVKEGPWKVSFPDGTPDRPIIQVIRDKDCIYLIEDAISHDVTAAV